jgi:hypothetical protein
MRPTDNLGDFVCDVTCSVVPRRGHPNFELSDLFDLWNNRKSDFLAKHPIKPKFPGIYSPAGHP